jgi:hypothetical protein
MLLRLTCLLLAGVFAGCDGGSGSGGDAAPDADVPDGGPGLPGSDAELVFITDALDLVHGEAAPIRVSYKRPGGRPVSGVPILLGLLGEAHDSSVAGECVDEGGERSSCLTPTTDAQGIVRAELVAGNVPAVFRVFARAPDGTTSRLEVAVSDGGVGDLQVATPYTGSRALAVRNLRLFPDRACGDRPWELLPETPARNRTVASSNAEVRLSRLPASRRYTLLAIGRGEAPAGGERPHLAVGCQDGVLVDEGAVVDARVPLEDLPVVVDGRFDLNVVLRGDAHPARVGERVRDVTDTAVAAAGGEAPLVLDALEGVVRSEEDADAALDALAEARSAGGEDAFASALAAAVEGPTAAADWLAATLEDGLATVSVAGEATVDLGASSTMSVEATQVSVGEDDDRLVVSLPAMVNEASVTWMLATSVANLQPLTMDLPLGQLAVATLVARLDAVDAASVAALLADRVGCAALDAWVDERAALAESCGPGCRRAACEAGYAAATLGLEARLRTFDDRRRIVSLRGRVDLTSNAAGIVSAMDGAPLTGDWSPSADEGGDAVVVFFEAVRR